MRVAGKRDMRAGSASRLEALEDRRLLSASLVQDINPTGASLSANVTGGPAVRIGTTLPTGFVFAASDGVNGTELWQTGGTASSTFRIKDINPGTAAGSTGAASSFPTNFFAAGDIAYFSAFTATQGRELWVTDGTAAGTHIVADLNSGMTSSDARPLGIIDDRLLFFANGSAGRGLYRTTATHDGAELVHAFSETPSGRTGLNATVMNGRLYFAAGDAANGQELWSTDGTTANTRRLSDIGDGSKGSVPDLLTVFNGRVYFTAIDSDTGGVGSELWSTDGTSVTLVADMVANAGGSSPSLLTVVENKLYFAAYTVASGQELWVLDADASAPVQVADLNPGSVGSSISGLTNFNGELFFVANTPATGSEIFKIDAMGDAVAVSEIVMGSAENAGATILGVAGNHLFFRASDGLTGFELYQTDGTRAGTFRTADITPGSKSSTPFMMGVLGSTLLFGASDGVSGLEPWSATASPAPAAPVLSDGSLLITGDDAIDYVRVLRDSTNGQIVVHQAGATYRYSGVTRVSISLAGGNDVLDLRGDLGVPLSVDGGAGSNSATLRFTDIADTINVVERYVFRSGGPILDYFNLQTLSVLTAGGNDTITIGTNVAATSLHVDGGGGNDTFDAQQANRGSTLVGGSDLDQFNVANGVVDSVDGGFNSDSATADINDAITNVESVFRAGGGTIGGVVFNDVNGNGHRDTGESGLGGWTITLSKSGGVSRSVVTAADGSYAASQLEDGSYTVAPTNQSSWQQAGTLAYNVILSNSSTISGIDFAPTQAALLGGYAMDDVNSNNIKDATETALAGATIYWDRNNNRVLDAGDVSDVTDSVGWYQIGIPVGVGGAIRTIAPAGYRALTGYPNGIGLGFSAMTSYRQDFGFTTRPVVAGRVFTDYDRDGTRDADENAGQFGATVWADLNTNGVFDAGEPSDVTDTSGDYDIGMWLAGTYTFHVTLPSAPLALTTASSFTRSVAAGEISAGNNFGVANTTPPSLTGLPADQSAVEGTPRSLSLGSFSDFLRDGPWQVTVNYGDGAIEHFTQTTTGSLGTRTHTYAESGTRVMTVTVTDAYGGFRSSSSRVNVANAAPTASILLVTESPTEGSAINLTGTATDASANDTSAGFTYTWSVWRNNQTVGQGVGESFAFTPSDNGTYVVTLTATDRDGGVSPAAQRVVAVNNLAPTATITGAATSGTEGQPVTLESHITDASPDDVAAGFIYAWTVMRDGSTYATGNAANFAFVPGNQGQYVVTLTARDKDGAVSSPVSHTVSVSNATPGATFSNAGPFAEGTSGRAAFTNIVDGGEDTHRFAFDLNNDGDFADAGDIVSTANAFVDFSLPDQGSRTIRGRVIDSDGAFRDYVTTLQFQNISATTVVKSGNTAQRNKDYFLTFATQDAPTDLAAGFRYQINWGDGSRPVTVNGGANGVNVSQKNRYKKAGQYTVTIVTTDKDGASSTTSFLLRVA